MAEVVSNATKSQVFLTLERELEELESLSLSSFTCIYKVPQILRNTNNEAFTPKVISIGPYHFGSKNLYAMQSEKKRYLQSFLKRTGLNLEDLVEMAHGWEEQVRGYYDEKCELNSDELVCMILIDGIFILEFAIQCMCSSESNDEREDILQESLKDDIIHDLMLLENQLPFFVLKDLENILNEDWWIMCLSEFLLKHFDFWFYNKRVGAYCIKHLVDFIHVFCVTKYPESTSSRGRKLEFSRSATELHEAGVKLINAESKVSTDIELDSDGALSIPHLIVRRNTESLFRNVIAYEQCHRKGHIFRSYVIFMDCLINTSHDVDLLVNLGIIKNFLGESEDVCTLFNNLYKMPMMDSREFHYVELCEKLNKYSRDPWHKWKATWFKWKLVLRREYFSSPWSIIAVIAAFILLSLAIIQTLGTMKSVNWLPKS